MLIDFNVNPAVLSDEVCDQIVDVFSEVPFQRAWTEKTAGHDTFEDFFPPDYHVIYDMSTDEEKADMEKELQELRASLREQQGGDLSEEEIDYRKVQNSLISPVSYRWIADILEQFAKQVNFNWGFDLTGIRQMELLDYKDRQDRYDWHTDQELLTKGNEKYHRKITIIVQLSDDDDYEGCDLQLNDAELWNEHAVQNPIQGELLKHSRQRGTIILFPSFIPHRITPLLSGNRKSLVAWVEGPVWK